MDAQNALCLECTTLGNDTTSWSHSQWSCGQTSAILQPWHYECMCIQYNSWSSMLHM